MTIGERFPLVEAAAAHRRVEAGGPEPFLVDHAVAAGPR